MNVNDYVTAFSENQYDETYKEIDSDIAPVVERINTRTKFTTRSSCSGTLNDHFDIDGLRDDGVELCDDPAFILAFLRATNSEVSIALKDEFHTIQSDERDPPFDTDVIVDGEYYEFEDAIKSVTTIYPNDRYAYPVSIEYCREMIPQWLHITVQIDRKSILSEVGSFEEYDAVIRNAYIQIIDDILCNYDAVLSEEFPPTLQYDLYEGRWLKESEYVDFYYSED